MAFNIISSTSEILTGNLGKNGVLALMEIEVSCSIRKTAKQIVTQEALVFTGILCSLVY